MARPLPFGVLFACSMILFSSLPAENYTTNSSDFLKMNADSFRDKHRRLITFNTDEDSDINIELSFNVPFVKIPVKKTMDATKGALANVNVGAIVLSSATFLMTTFIAPFVSYLFAKKKNNEKQGREDFARWADLFKDVDLLFVKNNLHSTSCLQRIVCSVVKNASLRMAKGSATSGEKIVDGIATSDWFRGMITNTFLESPVRNGLNNASCSKRYNKCKTGQRNVEMMLKQFVRKFYDRDT